MSGEREPLERALAWLEEGRRVAMATVVGTWGSSPRPPGSRLVLADDGAFAGSVSGGCIEGAVAEAAASVMAAGTARLLDFRVSDRQAWDAGLACGGALQVFLEPVDDKDLLRRCLEERPLALATDLTSATHALVTLEDVSGDLVLDRDALAEVRRLLALDRSQRMGADETLFVTPFNRPLRLIVVGAVHIAQSLVTMAAAVGYAVTVVDPRLAFGDARRFPGVTVATDWPDQALAALAPDERTAIVTLSHDPKLDDPALAGALSSKAFYIGALGSQKTQAARRRRLARAGFGEEDLARIHGPVGLDLGGRDAAEIAVAILAQIIAVRHGRPAAGKGAGTEAEAAA